MKKMKLLCEIEVSNNLSNLFETSSDISNAWKTFLSRERSEIDFWIAYNGNYIQRWWHYNNSKAVTDLDEEKIDELVCWTIQTFAIKKGIEEYLKDPVHQKVESQIRNQLKATKFVEEALNFCYKQFSLLGNLKVQD